MSLRPGRLRREERSRLGGACVRAVRDFVCVGCLRRGRRFVATGQQKATGPKSLPYVCIWDVDNCNQVQRLDHDEELRA